MERRFPSAVATKPQNVNHIDVAETAQRIQTAVAKYVPAAWTGSNDSGWVPAGQQILVMPDMPEEQTVGGWHHSPAEVSRAAAAAVTGILVAAGEGAFLWAEDRIHPWVGRKPVPGERITMQQYSGEVRPGNDGRIYRLMTYTSFAGWHEMPVEQEEEAK